MLAITETSQVPKVKKGSEVRRGISMESRVEKEREREKETLQLRGERKRGGRV